MANAELCLSLFGAVIGYDWDRGGERKSNRWLMFVSLAVCIREMRAQLLIALLIISPTLFNYTAVDNG